MPKRNEKPPEGIGARIEELRTKKNIKQHEMAKALFVDRVTVSQWENGTRDIKTGNIVAIAEYLGVSCDYLLGRTRVAAPDDFVQAINKRYGLSEVVLNELSCMPFTGKHIGTEFTKAMIRSAETMAYRTVLNLVLSHPLGKKALEKLATYFFAGYPNPIKEDSIPKYSMTWEVGMGGKITYTTTALLTDEATREGILHLAIDDFRQLRREQNGSNNFPPDITYTKDSSEERLKEILASYDKKETKRNAQQESE